MGLQCCGSVANLVLGVGLGVIALTSFAAAIMFFEYYDNIRHSGYMFDPNNYYYEMKLTSVVIAVFSILAAVIALGAISISGICEGKTGILVGVGGASCLFAFAGIVSQGVFFGYSVSQLTQDQLDPAIRNVSSAQKYILNYYKDIYETAVESLKQKDSTLEPDNWETVESRIGNSYNYPVPLSDDHHRIFTWNCLNFSSGCIVGINELKNTITFTYNNNGFVIANLDGRSIKVASTWFNHSTKNVKKDQYYTCWNTSENSALSCKYLEYDHYTFPSKRNFFDFFDLNQNIFKNRKGDRKIKYYNLEEQRTDTNTDDVDYNVKAPVAYHILKYNDVKDNPDENTLVYEKADAYYRVDPSAYLNYKYQQDSKNAHGKKGNKLDRIYLCRSVPNDLSDEQTQAHDCHKIYSLDISDVEDVLPYQFRQTNVGSFPAFFLSYKAYNSKNSIFMYNHYPFFAQFAVGCFVSQIMAILCYLIGKFLANKFKND